MTDSPRLSVIVTNYNYAAYVASAVDSALAQPGVEVVVVDDGSQDESRQILRGYGSAISLIEQPNGGQGAAFNAGFARSTAPIVVFLDADDELLPGLTGRLEQAFADPGVAKVQFPMRLVDGAGRDLGGSMPADPSRLARGDVRGRLVVAPDDLLWQPTSGNAFRRSVLEVILPMPEAPYRICADYYLSNLSAAHGTVAVLDAPGGRYRVHASNNHFGDVVSVRKLQENVARTRVTNELLLAHCRALGLPDTPAGPDALRSTTALANRMLSVRLAPERHPVEGDARWKLLKLGLEATLRRRQQVGTARRAVEAAWFVAVTLAPRRLVRPIAKPFVDLEPDARDR